MEITNYEKARDFLFENQNYLDLWEAGKQILKSVYHISGRNADKIKKQMGGVTWINILVSL